MKNGFVCKKRKIVALWVTEVNFYAKHCDKSWRGDKPTTEKVRRFFTESIGLCQRLRRFCESFPSSDVLILRPHKYHRPFISFCCCQTRQLQTLSAEQNFWNRHMHALHHRQLKIEGEIRWWCHGEAFIRVLTLSHKSISQTFAVLLQNKELHYEKIVHRPSSFSFVRGNWNDKHFLYYPERF